MDVIGIDPAPPSVRARLDHRRELFARIRAERVRVMDHLADTYPDERDFMTRASAVRDVVLVLGSPRGGTSVFRQVLAQADGALSWPGEHRLLFTLLGLNFPDHGRLDECVEQAEATLTDGDRDFFARTLLFECQGEEIAEPSPRERERFAWDWALRFRVQWPELDVPLEDLVAWVHDATADPRVEPTIAALRALRARGLPVNPHYYDLDPTLVCDAFPDVPLPAGPPAATIVEISPFLALRPRRRPAFGGRPPVLVLKASSDAYRIPLLHSLFRDWRRREIHLTRNPVAAVNGLLDGWAHHCFWQHDLTGVEGSGTARPYWNFDLCEGWQRLRDAPLVELCAQQWLDPHRRILRHAGTPVRVRFEEFQDVGRRRALMQRVAEACGLGFGAGLRQAVRRPRPVNQTVVPAVARWRRVRPHLRDVLDLPGIAPMCAELGYDARRVEEWG